MDAVFKQLEILFGLLTGFLPIGLGGFDAAEVHHTQHQNGQTHQAEYGAEHTKESFFHRDYSILIFRAPRRRMYN